MANRMRTFSLSPRLRKGLATLSFALAATAPPLGAQVVGQRYETPPAARPKVLSIRESVFSSIVEKAASTYRKEEGSQTFVLESTEGETRREWKIGGEARPLPENEPESAVVAEKRVKFLPHEGKLFVKIEMVVKGAPDREKKEIRFSGTYETTVLEGDWANYQGGGTMKVRIAASDHDRYLEAARRAFFADEVLADHAEGFRQELLGILEGKIADPGTTPPKEIEALRGIVATVQAHPECLAVSVTPSFEADPEIFVLEGEAMRSTVSKQTTTLRFNASLPTPSAAP